MLVGVLKSSGIRHTSRIEADPLWMVGTWSLQKLTVTDDYCLSSSIKIKRQLTNGRGQKFICNKRHLLLSGYN